MSSENAILRNFTTMLQVRVLLTIRWDCFVGDRLKDREIEEASLETAM